MGRGALATAVAVVLAATPAAARDTIFWGNETGNAISQAGLDGSGGGTLDTGAATVDVPAGTALDAAADKLYWANANGNAISVAALDGSGGSNLGILGATVSSPSGIAIAVANGKLYWANDGGLAVANLDGSGGAAIDTGTATVSDPSGVAVDPAAGKVYWANATGGGEGTGAISSASLDGSGGADLNTAGATVVSPSGLAVSGGKVYWANTEAISVAALDGSGGADLNTGSVAVNGATGIAIDAAAGRLYWANTGSDEIAWVALDGSGSAGELNVGAAPLDGPAFPSLLEAPQAATPPTLGREGGQFACDNGGWAEDEPGAFLSRAPQSHEVEWLRNGAVVPGARSASYAPTASGSYRCRVTASNRAGSAEQISEPLEIKLRLKLAVPRRWRAGNMRLRASCGALACKARISGYAIVPGERRFNIEPRRVNLRAGSGRRFPIKLKRNRASVRMLEALLRAVPRKRAKVVLRIVAIDRGGQQAKARRKVWLRP